MSDTTLTSPAPPAKKKRRARNSKADKYCDTCEQNITENKKRDMWMKNNTYHRLKTKEYCKEHELSYGDHKCKPIWCNDCKYLIKYQVLVDWDKKKI